MGPSFITKAIKSMGLDFKNQNVDPDHENALNGSNMQNESELTGPIAASGYFVKEHRSIIERTHAKFAGRHLIAGAARFHGAASVYCNERSDSSRLHVF